MLRTEAEAERDAAAVKTRQRIARDLRRASKVIAPLLEYIEARLFDPELRYERMREDCAIRDNNRSTLFRQEVGLTPAAYIRDCRFEVACRLLRDTDLDVARIGDLVGYRGPNVFGAAFRRWAGMTPASYRRQERRAAPAATVQRPDLPDLSPAAWRRFVEGELEEADADLLLRFLLDLYPTSRRRLVRELLRQVQIEQSAPAAGEATTLVPSLRSLFARDDIEHLMAEVVWEDIRDRPWPEQCDLVRHHLRFTTRALFQHLGERSREEGRRDRGRGIAIARLALEAASALEGAGDDAGTGPLKALAWAWLGNAKRLALDFVGADKAFSAARRRLPEDRPAESGEILSMQATLRRWQRRFEDALELASAAIPLLQASGQSEQLARTYLLRGIVNRELGDFEAAVADNELALTLVDADRLQALRLTAHFNLTRVLVDSGSPRAEQAISTLRRVAQETPRAQELGSVDWLEGLFAASRERWGAAMEHLEAARRDLESRGRSELLAVLSLDLAQVALRRGERQEARTSVERALPVFQALAVREEYLAFAMIHEDAREIVERLQEILETGGLTTRALQALQRTANHLADLLPVRCG